MRGDATRCDDVIGALHVKLIRCSCFLFCCRMKYDLLLQLFTAIESNIKILSIPTTLDPPKILRGIEK